jgi:hypothetical protein
MQLEPYVETIQRHLEIAADTAGGDARALAERLAAPLDAAIRLTFQDALAAAAEEITCDLAPGSVELRVRGRELDLLVTPPPADMHPEDAGDVPSAPPLPDPGDGEESGMARINLRLPDHLKARVEQAAGRDGLSVNAWLVRAAAGALDRTDPARQRPAPRGAQRYRGWAR